MRRPGLILSVLLVVFGLVFAGCEEDPCNPVCGCSDSVFGAVIVDVFPDTIAAAWQLHVPPSSVVSGEGDSLIARTIPGRYAIMFQDLPGWTTPEPAMLVDTLLADGGILFKGVYEKEPEIPELGRVRIEPVPGFTTTPWQLRFPGGDWLHGQGERTVTDVPLGEYSLTWEEIEGFLVPEVNPTVGELTEVGQTLLLRGDYRELGRIQVDIAPEHLDAPWRLAGPGAEETLAYGYGDSLLVDVPLGTYTLTCLPIPEWITPISASGDLDQGGTLELSGEYEEIIRTGTIAIEVEPAEAVPTWTLEGPNDQFLSGAEETVLSEMRIGEYTINWFPTIFSRPQGAETETLTLVEDGTITFSTIYAYEPPQDWIGVFLDPAGTVNEIPVPQGEFVTAYIIAHVPSIEDVVTAVEFSVENWIGNPGYPVGMASVEWASEMVMGNVTHPYVAITWPVPQVPDENANVLLGTITLFAHQANWPPANTEVSIVGYHLYPQVVNAAFESIYVGGSTCVFNPAVAK